MANKCHQTLIIKGNQTIVEKIMLLLNENDEYIRFSNLIPIPTNAKLEELELTEAEWCNNWYGISYDFGNLHGTPEIKENLGRVDFDTNWSPCCQFVFQLCQRFKDVNFNLSFNEPYGGFHGHIECENGEVLEEEFINNDFFERELNDEEFDKLSVELREINNKDHNLKEINTDQSIDSNKNFVDNIETFLGSI